MEVTLAEEMMLLSSRLREARMPAMVQRRRSILRRRWESAVLSEGCEVVDGVGEELRESLVEEEEVASRLVVVVGFFVSCCPSDCQGRPSDDELVMLSDNSPRW